jgi:integrase/recombinase XerD
MIQVVNERNSQNAITAGLLRPDTDRSVVTVKVYTRHKRSCPRREQPDWARCHCMKWLYVYRNGKDRFVSAKTRSWEKAEQKAREMRDCFDPAKQLQRQLEAKLNARNGLVEIAVAVQQFLQEVERLNREEATRSKYKLTLSRLLAWCAVQQPAVILLYQLDVSTLRSWILSWTGAPTTRHNQHQRLRTFFRFCMDQGWAGENPAKKIRNVTPHQEATLPFSRQQYDALIEATYYYDSPGKERNGNTKNSRRVRAYLELLRWSGLRAGDAACLPKSSLRDDDSLFVYQAKVRTKASAPVCVLLPHKVAEQLRNVPAASCTDPNYFFWSGCSKRKSEVSNWQKIFAKVVSKAAELCPKQFADSQGRAKPAHLHMLRDTFAVEYLLAGMPLDEVSRLLGHSSVTITQRHYAPWVLERQQRLTANQRAAWVNMGVAEKPHRTRSSRRTYRRLAHHKTHLRTSRARLSRMRAEDYAQA